jgi:hypothetical protein
MNNEMRDKLARGFPREKVKQKRGQGGRTMDYISHALITERLNEVDPGWSWRPIATYTYADSTGRLHCEGVEVELTIGGVSRVEAGGPTRQDGFTNEIKNAYSDAIKRAAMRFGVALSMWDSLVDAEFDEDVLPTPPALPIDMVLATLRDMDEAGDPYADIVQYAREQGGRFDPATKERLNEKVQAIAAKRKNAKQPAGVNG